MNREHFGKTIEQGTGCKCRISAAWRVRRLAAALLLLATVAAAGAQTAAPKREFRGAWIQAINGQLMNKGSQETQRYLADMLDKLQGVGVNAILFQVRPEADALYRSPMEPWSRFLTGRQGLAPAPAWDPLAFMVDECHRRGMELHAWINPYRAKTKGTVLAPTHLYHSHPERFVEYGGQLYFNPALQENRDYICRVAADIVSRYDVDGLHIDDYFYPYPAPGESFDDNAQYQRDPRGFADRGDWRRDNVNRLIEQLHKTLRGVKPWVKFGVSPFGIYRNKKSWPQGSDTNGLQGYDDLYADVLLWIERGWVDYCIPQVYWEIGHKAADYATLVDWWAGHAAGRPLFIGQDVNRTVKAADPKNPNNHQQLAKYNQQRATRGVQGSCQWDAASSVSNTGNYSSVLGKVYHPTPALQPRYPFIDKKSPAKVRKPMVVDTADGKVLCWSVKEEDDEMDRAVQFVVYRFKKGEKIDTGNAAGIVEITRSPFHRLQAAAGQQYTYVITALDRLQNESKAVKCKVKL